jgi:hypothetical protein
MRQPGNADSFGLQYPVVVSLPEINAAQPNFLFAVGALKLKRVAVVNPATNYLAAMGFGLAGGLASLGLSLSWWKWSPIKAAIANRGNALKNFCIIILCTPFSLADSLYESTFFGSYKTHLTWLIELAKP